MSAPLSARPACSRRDPWGAPPYQHYAEPPPHRYNPEWSAYHHPQQPKPAGNVGYQHAAPGCAGRCI